MKNVVKNFKKSSTSTKILSVVIIILVFFIAIGGGDLGVGAKSFGAALTGQDVQRELFEKRVQIRKQNNQIAGLTNDIDSLNLLLESRDSEIAFQAEEINCLTDEVAAQNLILSDQTEEIFCLSEQLLVESVAADSLANLVAEQAAIIDSLNRKDYGVNFGQLQTDLPTGYSLEYLELGKGKRSLRVIAPSGGNLAVTRCDSDCNNCCDK